MADLDKINAEIKKLNDKLDGISDKLVFAVEKYQREYERLIARQGFDLGKGKLKRSISNYNKAQSIDAARQLGFNTLAIEHIKQYDDIGEMQVLFNKRIGITADIGFRDVTIIKQFQNVDLGTMYREGQLLDSMIKKELVNVIALAGDFDQAIEHLSTSLLGGGEKTGHLARYAATYMRTSLFGLSRAIDKEIYDKIGAKEFMYSGPLDGMTRGFCRKRLGKTFTKAETEKFGEENESGLDGFVSPGGYNCRHRLIPVEN